MPIVVHNSCMYYRFFGVANLAWEFFISFEKMVNWSNGLIIPLLKTIMSSVKRELEGILNFLIPSMSFTFPLESKLVIPLLNTSSARQNSRGDNGSPCLTPSRQENKPSFFLFIHSDNLPDFKMTIIMMQNFGEKPNLERTLKRKGQCKVSKSLAISIFRATLPPKDLFLLRLIASEARHFPSPIFLPIINSFFSLEMMWGKIDANLSCRIFVMILCLNLARAICLYCSIVLASLVFGMRTRVLELK